MANLYNVGDIVYLSESSKLGFLESYKVDGVRQNASGIWFYKIVVPSRPGDSFTFGDRNRLSRGYDFELCEDELTTLCDALDNAITKTQENLNLLIAKRDSQCNET